MTVVYADSLAKKLMTDHPLLKKAMIEIFGPEAYDSEGYLNRHFLADQAFEKKRIHELNELVHPFVYEELKAEKDKAKKRGDLLFAHEAALIPESTVKMGTDVVIVIESPFEERIRRVSLRDATDRESVKIRAEFQPDTEDYQKIANVVIYNDADIEQLKNKAKEACLELEKIAAAI